MQQQSFNQDKFLHAIYDSGLFRLAPNCRRGKWRCCGSESKYHTGPVASGCTLINNGATRIQVEEWADRTGKWSTGARVSFDLTKAKAALKEATSTLKEAKTTKPAEAATKAAAKKEDPMKDVTFAKPAAAKRAFSILDDDEEDQLRPTNTSDGGRHVYQATFEPEVYHPRPATTDERIVYPAQFEPVVYQPRPVTADGRHAYSFEEEKEPYQPRPVTEQRPPKMYPHLGQPPLVNRDLNALARRLPVLVQSRKDQ